MSGKLRWTFEAKLPRLNIEPMLVLPAVRPENKKIITISFYPDWRDLYLHHKENSLNSFISDGFYFGLPGEGKIQLFVSYINFCHPVASREIDLLEEWIFHKLMPIDVRVNEGYAPEDDRIEIHWEFDEVEYKCSNT